MSVSGHLLTSLEICRRFRNVLNFEHFDNLENWVFWKFWKLTFKFLALEHSVLYKKVMRIEGLIFYSTKFFPSFELADVLAQPNSSH